ncbi:F-box/kelch-repeat protein At1g51550 [Oryza brachyantha]|uniref:F-box/kelch-repeat protein At1g51550 n=1 Tax=Oryza brachyantha TaxID=4533 RepID=UPI001ADB813F|nr:F-box/kelch-repeat protein At1g51550 [Oryza brachyantha]
MAKNRSEKAARRVMEEEAAAPAIARLGYDQVVSILHLLPAESVLSFAAACRAFHAWASSDALWEALCRRDWGARATAALAEQRRGGGAVPWRRIYSEVALLGALSARRVPVKGASPRPRASHSLNLVAGWLVLFGGGCEGGRHLDDTWVAYVGNGVGNRSSNVFSWQQLDSGIPSGRFGHSCSLVGDSLVLFGGINDQGQRLNDTWIGQIICEESHRMRISWRLLEVGPHAPPPRGAHAACCVDDKFIVIHGGIGLSGSRLGDTWLLDLSNGLRSGSWHQIGDTEPLPLSRSGHTLTWIGGSRMVLFGGRGSEFDVLNDVWLLDINESYPKWKELKYDLSSVLGEMPFPRVGHSATLIFGGKILVYGGEDSQRRRKDDFWILDLPALLQFESGSKKMIKRMWKKLRVDGQCPSYRSFHGACVDTSGCCVYIFGGMIDGLVHPAETWGLRFDGQLYQVELVLHL